ncbi:CLUMA_CG006782, isoform A [Clunio marinus]|uniref:CLUMA_CG006782, isoform A n=1 Tax=Clunio marinus TaxID=568069 RepID=A0A1J1I304_9DIPT|nr:CLUMA_CG006782, isoform A [Clunio marinus]
MTQVAQDFKLCNQIALSRLENSSPMKILLLKMELKFHEIESSKTFSDKDYILGKSFKTESYEFDIKKFNNPLHDSIKLMIFSGLDQHNKKNLFLCPDDASIALKVINHYSCDSVINSYENLRVIVKLQHKISHCMLATKGFGPLKVLLSHKCSLETMRINKYDRMFDISRAAEEVMFMTFKFLLRTLQRISRKY